MAPGSAPLASLKTEKGLAQLNELLASRSYIGETGQPTAEDFSRSLEIGVVPDRSQFPHVARWLTHIKALRVKYPEYSPVRAGAGGSSAPSAPAAKKGRAAGKEKQELDFDCKVLPWGEPNTPVADPPALGAAAKDLAGLGKNSPKYYITTAINYANGFPHIGHAYEALTSDVFARHARLMGRQTFFMTGSDEHGQKIAQAAADEGQKPITICNRYVDGFKALNQRLLVSNNYYVRTTDDCHKKVAQDVWQRCKKAGDIYLGEYEGWYLVREERFVTDQEAQEWNYLDPGSGKPLTKMCEASFFFRMTKYRDRVIKLIQEQEDFIKPQQYRTEVLERLKAMEGEGKEMRDLSISRGTFDWGIPCPEEPVNGQKHVMYVWFDALTNYLSGVNGNDPKAPLSKFWPADMHVIGKDISWFHCVIWPSMLMSAGLPLPKSVVVHGFIAGPDGRKMSKSYGNVVNPHDMLNRYSPDTLRWYLCRESPYGDDVKFSEDAMKLMHNADLCDNLGNLVNRAAKLCGGSLPARGTPESRKKVGKPFDLAQLKKATAEAMAGYRLNEAADLAVRACGATNKWIADLEPWKMKAEDQQDTKAAACRMLVEAVYVLAHFFAPFVPTAGEAIMKKCGKAPTSIVELNDNFENLKDGGAVEAGNVLFAPFDVSKDAQQAGAGAPEPAAKAQAKPKAEPKAEPKAKAKADKEKAKGGAATTDEDDPNQPLFSKLDVRVGRVVKAWHHPEADRLFVEEIDVGEPEGPRQIVSGLREHYSLEQFQGRLLLAVCNMKPAKLVKVESSGMVLCAKNPEKKVVELLEVPEGAKVGDRVLPEGVPDTWKPMKPNLMQKKKIWESIAGELRTNGDRVACFAGTALCVGPEKKRIVAPTLPDAMIS
eukprot:TRINITY_DN31397_c0_g1_i1.p1 TRINITY_DN31397_c0_g1~~TRINITY_DN31397_c0_g1_i1.p1  ORF type:complete len:903 (+),score=195.37 TRINITY_DN31397_c0_g1_i1:63-2711(+)